MTKDDTGDPPSTDKSSSDTQQQGSFHIVLVDIKKAALGYIRRVEKPLVGTEDLKFVALSYRWGECQEAIIDTGLGYMACITSFNLMDFYGLCLLMLDEPDLQHIDYVWVDSIICVNQANFARRKATIYQMTNIYKRATYILAVPDLHQSYLSYTYQHQGQKSIVHRASQCRKSIYHLIHHNVDELLEMDQAFFSGNEDFRKKLPDPTNIYSERNADQWKNAINEQLQLLCDCINFLEHLVRDWCNRVWVISECNIARNENKLKLWFTMLEDADLDSVSFFKFDFNYKPIVCQFKNCDIHPNIAHLLPLKMSFYYNETYYNFYDTVAQQLMQRPYLEMILKSKASKNEDRFHAIFPGSRYANKLGNKDTVSSWKINNLMSVKLKLYEIMNTRDKLLLLFISGNPKLINGNVAFPSFAATTIFWPPSYLQVPILMRSSDEDKRECNFDLTSNSIISLIQFDTTAHKDKVPSLYKLNLKPREYYLNVAFREYSVSNETPWQKKSCTQKARP